MARWTTMTGASPVKTLAGTAVGRFALRIGRELRDLELIDRGMTLAAHVFTSVLPVLIVAGALRAALDPGSDPIIAEHLLFDEATAQMLEDSLPGEAQELRATGFVGVILLVIAATSFARALERSLRTIWRAPSMGIRFAWRWIAALGAVLTGLTLIVATRILVPNDGLMPVLEFLLEVVLWSLLWWIASWIVINRRVSLPALLPGSVLAGIGFATAGLFGRLLLPPLLADSAARFGVLGMAFTYVGWLLVLSCILLISATMGRVLYLSYGGRAWRRSALTPARDALVPARSSSLRGTKGLQLPPREGDAAP